MRERKKSLAAADDACLRNVQASANQGKKCLLAKLIAEEENRNVRRHVGEEEKKAVQYRALVFTPGAIWS